MQARWETQEYKAEAVCKTQSIEGGTDTCELPEGQWGCRAFSKVSHESDLSETGQIIQPLINYLAQEAMEIIWGLLNRSLTLPDICFEKVPEPSWWNIGEKQGPAECKEVSERGCLLLLMLA